MTITNTKISTPVLSQSEADRAKAKAEAEAKANAPKGGSRKAAAPAPKAAAPANPFAEHEEAAESAINEGLKDVSPEEVRSVINDARRKANTAYFADLKGNALQALAKDQSRKQTTYNNKTSVAFLLGKA